MSFPGTQPILDPFDAPLGAVGAPNWRGPANFDASNLTVVAGGGAQAAAHNVFSSSVWAAPAAVATSAYVTLATLHGVGNFVTIGAIVDLNASAICYAYFQNTVAPTTVHITSTSGGDSSGTLATPPSNGDALGWSYDPNTDIATVWYRRAGSTAWVPMATLAALLPQRTDGWLLYLETNDGNTLRLRNFGGETMPNVNPIPVHGRGSC